MSSMVAPARPAPTAAPRPGVGVTNNAVRPDQRYRNVQLALFVAGAVLMPLGLSAILVGWYGTAHSHYAYDQTTYLISGGLLGLGLIFLGGFLYFGAWLAKVAQEQRDSARQLADTILVLADMVSRQPAAAAQAQPAYAVATGYETSTGYASPSPVAYEPPPTLADPGAVPVLAGEGSTVHRRDCALIAHRSDLRVLDGTETGLGTCRVCRPSYV